MKPPYECDTGLNRQNINFKYDGFSSAENYLACSIWAVTQFYLFCCSDRRQFATSTSISPNQKLINRAVRMQLVEPSPKISPRLTGNFETHSDSLSCFLCAHKNARHCSAQWGRRQQSWQEAPSPGTSGWYMLIFTQTEDEEKGRHESQRRNTTANDSDCNAAAPRDHRNNKMYLLAPGNHSFIQQKTFKALISKNAVTPIFAR